MSNGVKWLIGAIIGAGVLVFIGVILIGWFFISNTKPTVVVEGTTVQEGEPDKVTTSIVEPSTKKEPDKTEAKENAITLHSYIDETFEPLVRSVSANIDSNWEFYVIEPLDRLIDDGNVERFHNDIDLAINLSNGTIKKIDETDTPSHFSDSEIKNINEVKDELKNAINKRIEAIEILLSKNDVGSILNADVDEIIAQGNDHLEKSVVAYQRLLTK